MFHHVIDKSETNKNERNIYAHRLLAYLYGCHRLDGYRLNVILLLYVHSDGCRIKRIFCVNKNTAKSSVF